LCNKRNLSSARERRRSVVKGSSRKGLRKFIGCPPAVMTRKPKEVWKEGEEL